MAKRLSDVGAIYLPQVEERQAIGGVDYIGLPTGLYAIDRMTGGMGNDEMWTIGASTGVGKTSLALDIALHNADAGALFFSLEMRAEALLNRLLSRMTEISAMRIKLGKLSDHELRLVQAAFTHLSSKNLYIEDGTFTSVTLAEQAKRVREQFEFAMVCVDYLQILVDQETSNETTRIATMSLNIRNLARPDQLNMPIVCVSQLSRAPNMREDSTPKASDLKGSSQIEQDSQVVIMPHRPKLELITSGQAVADGQPERAKLIVAKNREGIIGATEAIFHPLTTSWKQELVTPVEPRAAA